MSGAQLATQLARLLSRSALRWCKSRQGWSVLSAGGKEGEKDGGADGVQDYDACSTRLRVWVIGAAAAGDEDCGRVCALSELLRSVMAV